VKVRFSAGLCAIILSCFTTAAFAVDGVVLIDQNRALAGNVTSGDAPGFPVTLGVAGSYRLSGNLFVPAGSDGIAITVDGVTLDLNGFQIAGGGTAIGVHARGGVDPLVRIVIRNGGVTNFSTGVSTASTVGADLRDLRVSDNAISGILSGRGGLVVGNTASRNLLGIIATEGSVVTGNTAIDNRQTGMQIIFSTATGNAAFRNAQEGFLVFCPSTLVGNVAVSNGERNIDDDTGTGCTGANNVPVPTP
jgi:hypothetical protein